MMTVRINPIQKCRVVYQIMHNLTALQRDIVNNAAAHKGMAQAQSPDVVTLGGFVRDSALEYLRRTQWVIDLRADPVRRQQLLDMLSYAGWAEQDVIDYVQDLRQVASALSAAPHATYADIIAACDAVIAAVPLPLSLWPE